MHYSLKKSESTACLVAKIDVLFSLLHFARNSHVSGGLSERGIVRVEVALIHVSLLGEASDDEPESHHDEDALPHSGGDLVPHLLIEQVNLLQALQVVQAGGSVGECPHSQVVHVRHDAPVVAEGDLLAALQETVLEASLAVASGEAYVITEILLRALQIAKLVHVNSLYYLFIIIINL